MPWYSRYFNHIIYGTIAFIVSISVIQARQTYKEVKRKPKFKVETNFKDTAK
jgi:hypothetical protein